MVFGTRSNKFCSDENENRNSMIYLIFFILFTHFLCIGPRFLPTLTGLKEQWKTKILKAHQRRRTILKSGQGPRRKMETMLLEMRWWDLLRSSIPVDGDDDEEQEIGDPWWVLVHWWSFRWRCRMVVGDGDKYLLWILKMKVEKKDDYWRGVRKHRIRKESEKKVTKFERNGEKIKQKIGKSKDKAEKKNKRSSKGENNETIQSKVKSAIFGEETH